MMMETQKTPSKYMVLATAQTILWLFGLPVVCRKYWYYIFGSLTPEVAEFALAVTVPTIFYLVYNILVLPVYYVQHPFFEQFKIQSDRPWPWRDHREAVRNDFWNLSKRSIKLTLFNVCFLLPVLSIAKILAFRMLNLTNTSAYSIDDKHWPRSSKNCHDILLMAILHEFGFYTIHRIMHSYPFLYKYHKIHHEYKMNTTLAALHNHPIDFILSIGGPFLLAVATVNPHSLSLFQFYLWTVFTNLDDHVGYSFPWSPARWFPFAATTNEHEFHHSKNIGCFGSKLTVFNLLFGGHEFFSSHRYKYADYESPPKKLKVLPFLYNF